MRILVLVGIICVALGTAILSGWPKVKSQEAILEVGEFKATVEERRALPGWVGILGIAGGVSLIVVGSRRRGSNPLP